MNSPGFNVRTVAGAIIMQMRVQRRSTKKRRKSPGASTKITSAFLERARTTMTTRKEREKEGSEITLAGRISAPVSIRPERRPVRL